MTSGPWLVLLAVLVYGVVHSFLASLWAKEVPGIGSERWQTALIGCCITSLQW